MTGGNRTAEVEDFPGTQARAAGAVIAAARAGTVPATASPATSTAVAIAALPLRMLVLRIEAMLASFLRGQNEAQLQAPIRGSGRVGSLRRMGPEFAIFRRKSGVGNGQGTAVRTATLYGAASFRAAVRSACPGPYQRSEPLTANAPALRHPRCTGRPDGSFTSARFGGQHGVGPLVGGGDRRFAATPALTGPRSRDALDGSCLATKPPVLPVRTSADNRRAQPETGMTRTAHGTVRGRLRTAGWR